MKRAISTALTPEQIFALFRDDPYAIFFDSSRVMPGLSRHSVILSTPFDRVFANREKGAAKKTSDPKHPMAKLRAYLATCSLPFDPSALPCENGCAAGYLSYDAGQWFDDIELTCQPYLEAPALAFAFYDKAVVIDHVDNATYVCASPMTTWQQKELLSPIARMDALEEKIKQGTPCPALPQDPLGYDLQPCTDRATYLSWITKAKDYIREGDIYQVNLSQRFSAKLRADPYAVYRRLRSISPAPFSCFLDFDGVCVLSNSPERFLLVADRNVETRPIKGTRRRGQNAKEDQILRNELWNSQKDRAELTMIVDLERNDLGRVCELGSIRVPRLAEIEAYANVFHLVATVTGTLAPDKTVLDAVAASFPGGSITGAPKLRAIKIIDELERGCRGVYTGSVGYIGFDQKSDFNIAIRTMMAKDGHIHYHVGGGIVWDSDPQMEYQETLDKGLLMRDAILGEKMEV